MTFRTLVFSSAALAAMAVSASAADLPAEKGPPVYAPPAFSWTGFYLGGQVGGAWSRDEITDENALNGVVQSYPLRSNGVIGSGTLGYNLEFNQFFVAGIEANIGGLGLSKTIEEPGSSGVTSNDLHSGLYGDVTGRLGYAVDRALFYVKGGWAFYDADADVNNTLGGLGGGIAPTGKYFAGWTVGGGLEYAIVPNWSVKIEYQHFDFGSKTANLPSFDGDFRFANRLTADAVEVGVNYHFDFAPPPAPPVVAKY